jgi:hypothetical protein
MRIALRFRYWRPSSVLLVIFLSLAFHAAEAQESSKMRRLGYVAVAVGSEESTRKFLETARAAYADLGYREGKT